MGIVLGVDFAVLGGPQTCPGLATAGITASDVNQLTSLNGTALARSPTCIVLRAVGVRLGRRSRWYIETELAKDLCDLRENQRIIRMYSVIYCIRVALRGISMTG